MSELSRERSLPFWHHEHRGEPRWPVALTVLFVNVLQFGLPNNLNNAFPHVVFGIQAVLLIALVVVNPHHIASEDALPRRISLALVGVMSIANLSSVFKLIFALLNGGVSDAKHLLMVGGSIWITNVVVFALWYWEFDRGGPAARARAKYHIPDFMFPQMSDPDLSAPHWAANFFDYLYISFTNSSAFSPTDVLPLTRWAKALMLVQSLTSLVVVALVIARAVNILH